jgi:cytochrome c553
VTVGHRTSKGAAAGLAVALLGLALAGTAIAAEMDALEQKAVLCAACHGAKGNSANPAVPSLAGQPKQFITTQLVMFREGNRKDPQMSPIAAGMANADVNDFGTYFTAQVPAPPADSGMDATRVATSQRLVEQYHCVSCHGAALKGQQHIPRLAGQQRAYLAAQLRGFKAGTRFDMDGNMTSAAQPLTESDIELVSEYLAALR